MNDENEQSKIVPVSVGDILMQQEAISEGKKGDAVCKYDNFIIFVNNTTKGEIVNIKILKVLKNFAIAERFEDDEEVGLDEND